MPGPRKKKSRPPKGSKKRAAAKRPAQLRAGMPAADSVREVVDFVSPQKVHYKILKTTETDAYDPPLKVGKKPKAKS